MSTGITVVFCIMIAAGLTVLVKLAVGIYKTYKKDK